MDYLVDFLLNFIKRNFLKKEFGLFLIVGGINTLNGTVFAFIYSFFLQANLAFALGYMTALTIAYFLNSLFVFKAKLHILKYFKFSISYIPNFIIQNAVVFVFYNLLHWNILLTYVLAAALGIPVTFLILKVFTFGRSM